MAAAPAAFLSAGARSEIQPPTTRYPEFPSESSNENFLVPRERTNLDACRQRRGHGGKFKVNQHEMKCPARLPGVNAKGVTISDLPCVVFLGSIMVMARNVTVQVVPVT